MRLDACISCQAFPCQDVDQTRHCIPPLTLDPQAIRMVLVSEAAAAQAADNYYAVADDPLPLFARTTLEAFRLAGLDVASLSELLDMGIYCTTAVKCGKMGYTLKAAPIKACSRILEDELALFPQLQVLMLMGDVAIHAINNIAQRNGDRRVIPAGSTYKIRGANYVWRDVRVFPSYVQAGPAFSVEASKRRMIAEDLRAGLALLG